MLNTSFLNKPQLKNKKIIFIFYFTGSDLIQCILSFEPEPVQPEQ
jgi:hypothetical protein